MDVTGVITGVIGLGISGLAAVRFLSAAGATVYVFEERERDGVLEVLTGLERVTPWFGPLTGTVAERLLECREILLSPGFPRTHPGLVPVLARGIPVVNDVEYLYRCDMARSARFVGITGTNGKSTVTTLVGAMLEQSGLRAPTGGNLGTAALDLLVPAADGYVLELSSFQLESVDRLHLHVGAVLNVTPDHLDRYAGMEDYRAAKLRVVRHQEPGDYLVLNADDPLLAEAMENRGGQFGLARRVPFSVESCPAGGVYLQDGWLVDHRHATPEPLLPVAELGITGRHNQSNAAAAAAIALVFGASRDAVVTTLRSFPGLVHRMELVRVLDRVRYVNDSKGTNVGATIQSLRSLQDVVLIAGGKGKKTDFAPLVPWVRERALGVVLIGESAAELARVLAGATRVVHAGSLDEAVRVADRLARGALSGVAGGEVTVLLSPACASFDQFRNFEDRGQKFREAVHGLGLVS